MSDKTDAEKAGSCLALLLIAFLFTFWTDRNLDFWLTHFKGQEVDCPFWLSFLFTLLGNGITLATNIIGEIGRLAL